MARNNAQGYCPVDRMYVTVAITDQGDGRLTGVCLVCRNTFDAVSNDPEFDAIVTLQPRTEN